MFLIDFKFYLSNIFSLLLKKDFMAMRIEDFVFFGQVRIEDLVRFKN